MEGRSPKETRLVGAQLIENDETCVGDVVNGVADLCWCCRRERDEP